MNRKNLLWIVGAVLLFSIQTCWAQGVQGRITDSENTPLPFATIFVQENGTGTTANVNGRYNLRLSPGDYTLVFQFLGHQTMVEKVSIGELTKTLDVRLPAQAIDLKVVDIYEGREDPAYTVMRKAIAKASYHRQQLDWYECQVYIKGTGRLKKTPRIFKKMLEKEGVDTSTAYTSESVSKFEYTRPNTFKETVISIYESGDGNSTSPNAYINGSFYEPDIAEAISPLSPKAFAYYRFKLEGFFVDREYGINKIKVTPRSRGENVFEGYIYIVEDLWSIYSTSLATYKLGIRFEIDQVYAPIRKNVWLPVSHKFGADGKIFGFGFEYNYLATVSDYDVRLNPDLDQDFTVIDEKLDRELAAQIKEAAAKDKQEGKSTYEKISSGEEITRKDLRRIIREYEKEERKAQEEPEVIENYSYTVDSTARKRDSVYWESIRPIPLTDYELKGYQKADSLAQVYSEQDSTDTDAQGSRSSGGKWKAWNLIGGDSYELGEKKYLSHGSLLDKILFNPVEGFSMHTYLRYSSRKENNRFSITATPRYAFAREAFSLKGDLRYTYGDRLKRSSLTIEGGRYIFQYNEDNPIDPHVSAFVNLFFERNYIRLYEKDYFKISSVQAVTENFKFSPSLEFANRSTLRNTSSQVWFAQDDRFYESNIPVNDEVELPIAQNQKAFVLGLEIETRPWQKFRVRNGRKEPIERSSPTLNFGYRKGVSGLLDSEVNYDLMELSIRHKFRVGVRGLVNFKSSAGIFLNDQSMGFIDFKHFTGNRLPIVTTDPVGSFRLLDYYRHSTADKFLTAHAHYQFRKFLVTQIPEVWLMGIKENLFVNYLATPTSKNYFELGYSIDNIFRFFRLEAAFSFQNGQYQDFGMLIGVASNLEDLFN